MAERRMFAKTIIDSDAFLDMPVTARLLYYDLSMRADDDGFVNSPKKIMRMIGGSDDDLKILAGKKFIIPFETGVVVIKHWKIHNYIRKDTYNETPYKEEKALLEFDENNAYRLTSTDSGRLVDGSSTQDRIGKDRIGKDRIGKDRIGKDTKVDTIYFPYDEKLDKAFKDYIAMRKHIKAPMTEKAIELAINKLESISTNTDEAIAIINQSILNSWKGLFPLKEESKQNKSQVDEWLNA